MPSVSEDSQFVIQQWNYLFGRNPTQQELEQQVNVLQSGVSRADFNKNWEKANPEDAVTRMYQDVFGRPPSQQDLTNLAGELSSGRTTREQMRTWLQGLPEAQLRAANPPSAADGGPTADQESAKAYLSNLLDQYDLGSLGDWAWGEIQNGASPDRVIQDLRQRPEYKQRFAGLDQRRANGLPSISESQYIAYESAARQTMRAAGMPAGFFDSVDDFAGFIGNDTSIEELQSRINDGYLAATNAAGEIRGELSRLYGDAANALVTPGQLAAFFLDDKKALPVLMKDWNAAINAGTSVQTGYGQLAQSEAERLADLGVTQAQAQQGFSTLVRDQQLFSDLPGEFGQNISRTEQQEAMFGNNVQAQQKIEAKAQSRVSAGSGAQAFQIGNGGVAGLGKERR